MLANKKLNYLHLSEIAPNIAYLLHSLFAELYKNLFTGSGSGSQEICQGGKDLLSKIQKSEKRAISP